MFWMVGGFVFFILFVVVFLFAFWIWMLIDCLQRKKFEDKLVWVLVLILLNVIGAILYYLLVKSKGKR